MASYTPNNNLKKPAGTDYVLVGDLNGNMDILDGKVGNLAMLNTPQKTSLVDAINQASTMGGQYAPMIGANGNWWVWDTATAQYIDGMTAARGPMGITGAQGPGGTLTINSTITGAPGTSATVTDVSGSTPQNRIVSVTIPRGTPGEDGENFRVLGLFPTLDALVAVHPTGNPGDSYAIGLNTDNDIYIWNEDNSEWEDIGKLQGPQGPGGYISITQTLTGDPGTNATVTEDTGSTESNRLYILTVPRGSQGVQGPQGTPGVGIPSGGTNGQFLQTDGTNASWEDLPEIDIPQSVLQYIPQTLTTAQQLQSRTNIGAGTSSFTGNYTDLSGTPDDILLYNTEQILTTQQQTIVREKIGAGTSLFSGNYNDLTNKPTIPTTAASLGALPTSGGTMTGNLITNNPAIATQAARNIYAGTSALTSGTSVLTTGAIYLQYE